jgi:putative nucleotidyltransferase with HDIG domain
MSANRQKKSSGAKRPVGRHIRWLLLAAVITVFIVLLYPDLIVQPHPYQLGDIAERSVKAPRDFFVEDQAATQEIRAKAIEQVLTVYDFDPRISMQTISNLRKSFENMRLKLAQLSSQYAEPKPVDGQSATPEPTREQATEQLFAAEKDSFRKSLGIDISDNAYRLLADDGFSKSVSDRTVKIIRSIQANGVVANKEIMLKEIDRGITLRNIADQKEMTVTALRQYYGPEQAKTMVRIVAGPLVKELNFNLINLIVELCQRLVQPNITLNRNETERRKEQALAEIKPVMLKFKAGEMIVQEGRRINAEHLLILRAMAQQARNQKVASSGFGAAILLAVLLMAAHRLYFHQQRYAHLDKNKNIIFLALVLSLVFIIVKISAVLSDTLVPNLSILVPGASIIYAAPVAAGAMLICLFLGFEVALPFSVVAAFCAAVLSGSRIEIFTFFLINNSMAAYWVKHCRERKVLISAGIKLGLLNVVLATTTSIYAADYAGIKLIWDWGLAFLGGLVSAIVTIGMAPLLEMSFRYTTDISLLELANLDSPILHRLMIEAPGTYHHSVIVGTLGEAAATDIGANPLMAKVCGYYHDIGKVKKPLYFIENQADGVNRHDKLAPSMSSLILTAHIKDGVDIARKNRLGQPIIDAIRQHHGTSLISYFFEKAKHLKGAATVKIDDYRYPGPKPQTKEAGLVMLADVVEAASRTLENPTPARIQGLVQNLINKIFSDGQLDHCELTLKDLHSIAKSFYKILNGIHHHRIEYTETSAKENGGVKHDGTDRKPAVKPSDPDRKSSENRPGHIKRLGLS